MTIETKTAKSYKEAMELVKEFHAMRPDCYFVYRSENYSDDYKTTNRFFGGMGKDGWGICFTMIEFVKDGKLDTVRVINTYRQIAIDIKIEIEETAENKIAKFEEGKTYFNIWNQEDGRPHMRHYTIVKRTPKTIVLKSGYRCRIFTNENGVEAAKVGYGTYIYAKDVCTIEAANRQRESDKAWNEIEADQRRRYNEIKATFFNDKIAREVKAYDEKLTANVMPPTVDEDDDELVDPPTVEIEAENTAEEKPVVTTKIAKNGTKFWYVNGKRTNREVALKAAADSRKKLFTIEYETRYTPYFTGQILDATRTYKNIHKAVLKNLELKIDDYHGFAVLLRTIGFVDICKLYDKDRAKSLINKIENAFIRGEFGVKIDIHGRVSILIAEVTAEETAEVTAEITAEAELDGSEDDPDDQKDVFKLLPAIESLNDVDETTLAQVKVDATEPQDEFSVELAKLKAAVNDTQDAFIKAQDAHEQATDALKNFLNDTAFKLKQKLDALPLDYTITLKKTSGATYHFPDFSEIYIGAYHIGCDAEFHFENWRGRTIARYNTPAQVESVIHMLKAAIERGDEEFTFPTVDELNTPPKMPPCAPKSPDITAKDNLPIEHQNAQNNAFNNQIALLNENAPKDWKVSFDADKNNFPVKFKDKTITTLDSLALAKVLPPDKFFEQFRPLVDTRYSPKHQFIDDRRNELAALQEMRKLITDDAERLKSIDDMIDDIKRDLLEIALE